MRHLDNWQGAGRRKIEDGASGRLRLSAQRGSLFDSDPAEVGRFVAGLEGGGEGNLPQALRHEPQGFSKHLAEINAGGLDDIGTPAGIAGGQQPRLIGIAGNSLPRGSRRPRVECRQGDFVRSFEIARMLGPRSRPGHRKQHVGRRRAACAELGDLARVNDEMMRNVIGASGVICAGIANRAEHMEAAAGHGDDAVAENHPVGIHTRQPRKLAGALDSRDEQRAKRPVAGHRAKAGATGFEGPRGTGVDELPGHRLRDVHHRHEARSDPREHPERGDFDMLGI